MNIGILHPGLMGISVAASAQASGHPVSWVSAGRSSHTAARAAEFGLIDAGSLTALCRRADLIISVCPPHAAETVANQVAAQRFQGLYLDANAISPQRAQGIGDRITAGGGAFVDGGIIGGPAWQPGTTWLYLSGAEADRVAACFAEGALETAVIGEEVGKASALKVCFAAYTKGSTALLAAILAASDQMGVRGELEAYWSRDGSDFAAQAQDRARRVTAKAWRFAGEMDEIASAFAAAGLPGEFHQGAAEIYRRLAQFKDAPQLPELAAVIAALTAGSSGD